MNCPMCDEPLMQMVQLFIWCPASERNFNKTALRRKAFKVSAAKRPDPMKWVCLEHGTLGRILEQMDRTPGVQEEAC